MGPKGEPDNKMNWSTDRRPQDELQLQEVSRWLRTAAARVRAQVRSCGICGEQSEVLQVSPANRSTDCSTHRHVSSRAGTIGQIVPRRTKWT
jgi:endonuclease/exonuclease/phosphatase (EEP) superfamily protein YafD